MLRYRQSQSSSLVTPATGTIRLREAIENGLLFFGRNADSGIADGKKKIETASTRISFFGFIPCSRRTSLYGTSVYFDRHFAALGKLDRIAEKIFQQLLEPRPITKDSRRHFSVDSEAQA